MLPVLPPAASNRAGHIPLVAETVALAFVHVSGVVLCQIGCIVKLKREQRDKKRHRVMSMENGRCEREQQDAPANGDGKRTNEREQQLRKRAELCIQPGTFVSSGRLRGRFYFCTMSVAFLISLTFYCAAGASEQSTHWKCF